MILEQELFARHAGKSVLLDSNLLLVLLAGSLGPRLFKSFKRVSDYSIRDYELLLRLLESFRVLVTTPHILTEVSNLANSTPEPYKREYFEKLAAMVITDNGTTSLREDWTAAKHLACNPEFTTFGITDSALADLAPRTLVVTSDYRLSGALRVKGIAVLNFTDLRKMQALASD